MEQQNNKIIAKPFVKWAGGKGALIKQLVNYLPNDIEEQQNVTYIEPFVGGGAMLFYMLTHYTNIKRAIINDVNEDLISCYLLIKNDPLKLIALLREIKEEYYQLANIEEKTRYTIRCGKNTTIMNSQKGNEQLVLFSLIRLALMAYIG